MKLADGKVTLHAGDCLEVLATLAENSIDAVVTDPPYELGFMGKSWDASGIAFCPDTWRLVWRVLKPGGHLVAFGAPKNYHRLACAIEDAGFELRDSLMWVTGQGFPKSRDISKDIDKKAGADREIVGTLKAPGMAKSNVEQGAQGRSVYEFAEYSKEPITDAAREWSGWGTALKPAYEPIVLARKPLSEGTVAANVLRWGTGALNIDATRIATDESTKRTSNAGTNGDGWRMGKSAHINGSDTGRWPANLCHDGSQGVLDLFPQANSTRAGGNPNNPKNGSNHIPTSFSLGDGKQSHDYRDSGSAARFFYCAKASKHDRAGSKHPTVKPINLMRWLVRMVTPPNGTVLDPFAGSGTTGLAAHLEGFEVQLIEREAEYQADIRSRFDV